MSEKPLSEDEFAALCYTVAGLPATDKRILLRELVKDLALRGCRSRRRR